MVEGIHLSRRNFLRYVAASTGVAALPAFGSVSIDENQYTNVALGVSLQKPDDWQFVSAASFESMLDTVEPDLARPDLQQAVRDLSGQPILVIAKRSLRTRGFVPTIQLLIDPISHTEEEFQRSSTLGQWAAQDLYEDYEVEKEISFRTIDGFPVGEFVATATLEHQGVRYDCRQHYCLVLTDRAEFTLGCFARRSGKDESTSEFEQVVGSLRFAKETDQ